MRADTDSSASPTPGAGRRSVFLPVFVAGALVALVGVALWVGQRETRALRDLPVAEREALYRRTLASLTELCRSPAGAELETYCAGQADIARQLPECDAGCRELVGRYLPGATR